MSEPITLRSPEDLTLEVLEQVAWNDRRLALHPELLARIGAAREAMLEVLAGGGQVYGINTGMGYLAGVQLGEKERQTHQANMLLGRAVGGPPYLEHAEARAILVARLGGFLSGAAGVTPELCAFIVGMLNDDLVPAIPRTGVGCAGEIIPLAHAFGPAIGVGLVLAGKGNVEDAGAALAARGIEPYRPAAKEGIALLAGAPGAAALAAAHLRSGRMLWRQSLVAAACAIDAMRAPLSAYDPVLANLANDPLLTDVLAHLNDLLRGSGYPLGAERRPGQAPVSFRVIPQVLAHLRRTLDRMGEDVRRSLTAVTDSPAFIDGRFVTSGGFHAIDLASDLDFLCIALVHVAELAVQHIHRLLDSRFTGLPDQLTPTPGPRTGLVAVHKRAVGALNELRRLTTPATVGIADTSMGQEDAMTFTFEAAEKLRRTESLVGDVIACEILLCRQAWELRPSPAASGLEPYAREIAAAVPPIDEDRPFGEDIERLKDLLGSGELAAT